VFAAATALVASGTSVLATQAAWAAPTGGAGASLPYIELQAENAATNGSIIGPSASGVTYGTLQDEASYRKAVTLSGTGQYVEFTTTAPTNSIDFRYSIPDTSSGSVYTAPISLYINGTRQSDFTLTNAYSWYYGSYPFTNTPGSNPHHFYDEAHRLFSTTYPAGTKFRIQADSMGASSYTIDFADFEQVGAPIAQPAGSVSVTSKGADPSGAADSTAAFNAAISAAGAGGTVWIPQGAYNIPGHIAVNNVTVTGAGMWYSIVKGSAPGFYGNSAPNPSQNVHLSNFAIFGDVQERNDGAQVNGIGGAMSNSDVSNIWIDHLKVGAWMDGPFDKLTFSGMRIRDTTADGVNFHGGVTNSTVTNSDIRNTGDDGLATWADASIGADAFDTFSNNTVQLQILANGIAIYGGHDNTVSGNRVVDSGLQQGGGIHVAQRFSSTPLGLTTVINNTMIRDGSLDANWQFGVGSLWFDARDGAMGGPVNVSNFVIQQAPYEAIQAVSGSSVGTINFSNGTISGVGTYVLQAQTGGTGNFTNVTATGWGAPTANYTCSSNFTIVDNGGNGSWITARSCSGSWPTPVWPPYPSENNVSVTPTSLSFGSQATGTTSSPQTVTVSNNGSTAQSVSSTISGQYAQTNNCGSSVAAGASCSFNVTFSPTTAGSQSGTLGVTVGGALTNVSLSGTGVAPGPILNANPTSLSFASTVVGNTTGTQAVTITNTGTASATVSGVSVSNTEFTQSNNCTTIAVNASCTVNVAFKPAAGGARSGTLTVASNANNAPTTVSLSGTGIDSTTNIAAGKAATASSSNGTYVPGNTTDADASTYWESANGAWPQWLQVDLGSSYSLSKLTLKLPPATSWSTRTETIAVSTSADGTNFTSNIGATGYTFDPSTGNTVSINMPASASGRYVRLTFTANTGWNAGQLSDFQVFPGTGTGGGGGGGTATLTASPTSLSFPATNVGSSSAAQSVTVSNTGTVAASVSGISVSNADYSQTNTCGTSIAAGGSCTVSVTFKPTASGTRTGTLTVSSNATNPSLTVSLTGTGNATSTNLALGKPTSESNHTQTYASGNVTDGNQATYWESVNGSWPAWVQVDLGSAQTVGRVVLQLPTTWGARTQTLSILGSTDGTNFTTLKASAAYTFSPSSNTVTITFTAASERYIRVNITANNVQNGGQVSELQVWNS
jgi:hypothetical protein